MTLACLWVKDTKGDRDTRNTEQTEKEKWARGRCVGKGKERHHHRWQPPPVPISDVDHNRVRVVEGSIPGARGQLRAGGGEVEGGVFLRRQAVGHQPVLDADVESLERRRRGWADRWCAGRHLEGARRLHRGGHAGHHRRWQERRRDVRNRVPRRDRDRHLGGGERVE